MNSARTTSDGAIVVLEGLPGSGKTTIGRLLEQRGWVFLPEVATMAFENGLPVGDSASLDTELYILCEEVRREERARSLLEEGHKVCLESSHLTHLAFSFARHAFRLPNLFYRYLLYYTRDDIRATRLVPQLYAYLECSLEASIRRQEMRKEPASCTTGRQFLASVCKTLNELHRVLEVNTPRIHLDATRKPIEIADEIEQLLSVRTNRGSSS